MGWGHLEGGDDDDSVTWLQIFSCMSLCVCGCRICRLNGVAITQVATLVTSFKIDFLPCGEPLRSVHFTAK